MKINLRVSVQQSRWMIKLVPYVNWDVREKTSCCDIIETNTNHKSKEKRCSPTDRGIYTAAAADRGTYAPATAILRVMKKNPNIFWKSIILTHFTFPINTIPIISCHGSIHLPVWSQDQPKVGNPSLSGDSYTISNTWWPQYQIASCDVMENTRRYAER